MSKKMIVVAVLAVLIGFSGVSFHAAQQTEVIRVPQDFSTIQEAINASLPGDTIRVDPKPDGEPYKENLVIGKGIKLIGADRDEVVIKGAQSGKPVILIESNLEIQVTIESLTVTEARGSNGDGIRISGNTMVAIENVQASGNEDDGLEVEESAQAMLINSTVSGNKFGLFVRNSAQVNLTDSIVSGNGKNGLWVKNSAQVTLTSSTVSDNRDDGLFVDDSAQATLTSSTISSNGSNGLIVRNSAQATLTNSTISSNGRTGLFVGGLAVVEVRGSVIKDNQFCGIGANEEAQVTGGGNTVVNNRDGELCGNVLAVVWRVTNTTQMAATVPNDFPTIQEAINALQPGGTLTILPKADGQPYRENLQIYKDLILTVPEGDRGQVVLDGAGKTVVNHRFGSHAGHHRGTDDHRWIQGDSN